MEREEIPAYIEKLIQGQKGLETKVNVENIEVNNDGFTNDIALLNLNYSKTNETFSEELILKRFSSDAGYVKEVGILISYEVKKHVKLPTLYFEEREQKIVLMEKVRGITLDRFIVSKPAEKIKTLNKLGETLAHIHSTNGNDISSYFSNNILGQEDYIESYIHRLKKRVEKSKEPLYLQILDKLADRFKSIRFNEVLNHGDYHFRNILMTDENEWVMLDWEKSSIADYRFDLANTLVLGYSWFGIDFKRPMLEGYSNVIKEKVTDLDCFEALMSFDSFTKTLPLIEGADDSHIRDKSFNWLKRRYELFVKYNGVRIKEVEDFLLLKGLTL